MVLSSVIMTLVPLRRLGDPANGTTMVAARFAFKWSVAMDTLEDRIRRRAYELWEQGGRTGDPEDHWMRAERELSVHEASAATVDEANPADAVAAEEAVAPRRSKE